MTRFPFTAIVGQEQMKLALALNAIAPEIGGVLIQGERGTAKSTAVRALAALLPDIPTVSGCELGCDPQEPAPFCPYCRELPDHPEVALRPAPLVDLPLGASEDRVLGHLDLGAALGEGLERFRPGLLFQADRGVLYVDEVNLLADHLVDVLLDAAASGWHAVEREGFSMRHAARFVLVGTMNPEEGDLRPQLLDRFGLGVMVETPSDRAERALVVERRMAFERDPIAFLGAHEGAQTAERERIARGRHLLQEVEMPKEALDYLVGLCAESGALGMRADLVTYRAARALAAYRGRTAVTPEDVYAAAQLALFHRGGRLPEPSPPSDGRERAHKDEGSDGKDTSPPSSSGEQSPETHRESAKAEGGRSLPERLAPLAQGRLRQPIRWQARRLPQRIGAGGGRHLHLRDGMRGRKARTVSASTRTHEGIAWPESIRHALLRTGLATGGPRRTPLRIRPEDLLRATRADRLRLLTVLLVDASGSMGAYRRMALTKAAVLALVERAYQARERVAVLTFRGQEASVLVPPTSSVRLAKERLGRLRTGGRTPLGKGLALARAFLAQAKERMPDYAPVLIVLSDGRANVAPAGRSPAALVLEEAERIRQLGVLSAVVDTSEGYVDLGLARQLADALQGPCLPVDALVEIARKEVSA